MQGELTLGHHQLTTPQAVSGAPAETPGEPGYPVTTRWTGREASALRLALRMTYIEFAAYLGVGERTVAYWPPARGSCRYPSCSGYLTPCWTGHPPPPASASRAP